MGLRQGALSGAGEERHALVRGAGPGQHLSGAHTPDGMSAPEMGLRHVLTVKNDPKHDKMAQLDSQIPHHAIGDPFPYGHSQIR